MAHPTSAEFSAQVLEGRRALHVGIASAANFAIFLVWNNNLSGIELLVCLDKELHRLHTLPCIVQNLVIAAKKIARARASETSSPDSCTLYRNLTVRRAGSFTGAERSSRMYRLARP